MVAVAVTELSNLAGINELTRLLVMKGILTGDEGHQVVEAMARAQPPGFQSVQTPKP